MRLIAKAQRRLNQEQGFTLIELLIVLVIIGILLAIAVPSYLGFKDRANSRAAQSNLRAAIPSAEAFYADNGTYVGLSPAALQSIDSGLDKNITMGFAATLSSYCLADTVGNKTWSVKGPGPAYVNDSSATDSWYPNATCT